MTTIKCIQLLQLLMTRWEEHDQDFSAWIRFKIIHYKVYFVLKKISRQNGYTDIKPIPFFIYHHLIIGYVFMSTIIICGMIKFFLFIKNYDEFIGNGVAFFSFCVFLYLILYFFHVFIYKTTPLSVKFEFILQKDILLMKKKPNKLIYKAGHKKATK